jgi:hypothetical protein
LVKSTVRDEKKLEKLETKKAAGAPPKKVLPAALAIHNRWRTYVRDHILENGWEEFVCREKSGSGKCDTKYPKSVIHTTADGDDVNIFEGSIAAKSPDGKQPSLSHAMAISERFWSTKNNCGENEGLYKEFLAQYDAPEVVKVEKPVVEVVSMTMAEKEKLADQTRQENSEKAKQKRLAAKAVKASEPKSKVPAKAIKAAKPAMAESVAKWAIPDDGRTHDWTFEGKAYLANYEKEVFEKIKNEAGELVSGDWVGIYDLKTNTILKVEDPYLPAVAVVAK